MVIQRFTRYEVVGLADRLWARGTSRMLSDRPELATDLRAAAGIIRAALETGWPTSSIEAEIGIDWPQAK